MSLIRLAIEDSRKSESNPNEVILEEPQMDFRVYQEHGPKVNDLDSANLQRKLNPSLDYLSSSAADAKFRTLLVEAMIACEKSNLKFLFLSTVQRKFITHYRCTECGLLPLYRLNLTHPKRVRCGNCGQTVSLRNGGKYGRLRKEIAFELWRTGKGWGGHYDRK